MDFIFNLVFLLLFLSPFLFLYLNKKRVALVNVLTIILYLGMWGYVLSYKGSEFTLNLPIFIWIVLLVGLIGFYLTGISLLFKTKVAVKSPAVCFGLNILGTIAVCVLIVSMDGLLFEWSYLSIRNLLLVCVVPVYSLFLLFTGLKFSRNKKQF